MTIPETFATVTKAVCDHSGVSEALMMGDRRTRLVCKARWACWTALREAGFPFMEIAHTYGRTHGSVISGIASGQSISGQEGKLFRDMCEVARESIRPK